VSAQASDYTRAQPALQLGSPARARPPARGNARRRAVLALRSTDVPRSVTPPRPRTDRWLPRAQSRGLQRPSGRQGRQRHPQRPRPTPRPRTAGTTARPHRRARLSRARPLHLAAAVLVTRGAGRHRETAGCHPRRRGGSSLPAIFPVALRRPVAPPPTRQGGIFATADRGWRRSLSRSRPAPGGDRA